MTEYRVEIIYWVTIKADSIGEAENIGSDIRITNPQTSETIAPTWVGAWEIDQDGESDPA